MRHLILVILFIFSGCSTIHRMALRSASPMMVNAGNQLTTERSWEFFKDSAPANLKFVEMLYLQDPNNLMMLGVLVKGYAGYAFAVPETLSFGDEISGLESSPHKSEAITLYTRSLDYGINYLNKKDISHNNLLHLEESALIKLLDQKLDPGDYSTVLYTAQAWGSLINLQKENVALVSLVPRVKIMFDWVCLKDPEIENGMCEIFYAQYEAARPKMLGGNPEKAKILYEGAFKKRSQNLLIRVAYIQQMIIPAFDTEAYSIQEKILKEEFSKWNELKRDELEDKSEYGENQNLNLFNAIALKRFQLIEKNKTKIF